MHLPNRTARPVRLTLEQLEARWVPTTVSFIGSTLTISSLNVGTNGHTNLQVSQTTAGSFQVLNNGSSMGTYSPSNITIVGSTAPNQITVTLDDSLGNGFLHGNLSITGGNANDTISIDSNTSAIGTISGSLTVSGGNGNRSLAIGATNGLTVDGSTQLYGGLGNDTIQLGNATQPVTLKGTLGLHAIANTSSVVNSLDMNYTLAASAGLSIDNQISPTSSTTKTASLNVTLPNAATVPGSLQVVGSTVNNTVSLGNDTVGALVTSLPLGGNSVTLSASTVNGSAALTFGTGNNTVSISGGSIINNSEAAGGSLTVNMGAGSNSYTLSGFTVYGNVTIDSPSTGTIGQNITFAGTILNSLAGNDGNLTVNLGNGNNTFTFSGSIPVTGTFSYDAPAAGGHVTSTGNDIVTINLGTYQYLAVKLYFGFGDDTLNWVGATGSGASGMVVGVPGRQALYTSTNSGVTTSPNMPEGVYYYNFPSS